ncbi:MAG: group II intron reverse transcriptase/maturase [Spirochaetaceae bacterium]|nr:group II intron reverse transcriptase/maturase [Spirochaetaceae bacterium]MCF7949790.1 group II intron reverse transcriptase/maturase [Spirochaetia bacterium]MCF7952173.1 group II intron reverse transcriptase/maturase [Spirochaetaceae bacterium]
MRDGPQSEARRVYYTLYGRLLEPKALVEAFRKVKRSKGAPGIDGQSVDQFEADLGTHLRQLREELQEKSYRPLPVRRVEIPKPDGGVRKLGIPAVRDRIVQQMVLDVLQPIFDPHFHPSSYGYRPGRGCHQAIGKAQLFIRRYDMPYVVDMDLSKCFDRLDHELIIRQVRTRVRDGSILRLLMQFLKSGVMEEGVLEETREGSPQGGVISPLLANIYLDAFDQFTRARGYRIVRYADDILIFASSSKGAQRRMSEAVKFLEEELKLVVNREKTELTTAREGVKFLGVVIHGGYTRVQEKKRKAFKAKVKAATRRTSQVNLQKVIADINPLLRGYAHYFRVANCQKELEKLMCWIRHRLRAKQMQLWKKPDRLHRQLRKMGYKGSFEKIRMQSWRTSSCTLAHMAMPKVWFNDLGLFDMSSIQTGYSVSGV